MSTAPDAPKQTRPKCPICQAQAATRIRRSFFERLIGLFRPRRRKWECDVCGHLFRT